MQEHSVVNFTTATTCDTITIHTGKAVETPLNLLSATVFKVPCLSLCTFKYSK